MLERPLNNLKSLKLNKGTLKFDKTLIIGILNVTPDSFSDGGKFLDPKNAIQHAMKMVKEGADIIDIGAQSSRPGSIDISSEEELKRIIPIIKGLVNKINIPISVDTYKSEVAEKCLELGVSIINDIYGLRNEELIRIIKKHNATAIIMHMKGSPETMQQDPKYKNVVEEIYNFLKNQALHAKQQGIKNIIIDPGIGFGKTVQHNLQIFKNLKTFKSLKYPLLIGTSRKSFIGRITHAEINDRLPGTIASNTLAIISGANILRVHDVKEAKQAAIVIDAILNENVID